MKDVVNVTGKINEIGNVMLNKTEVRVADKVLNVSHIAGKKVVNGNDPMTGSK
jgi:NADP-dependent 3-hydroxy acid dehydrogenase YdfG